MLLGDARRTLVDVRSYITLETKRLIDIHSILRRCILVVHSRETFLTQFI